jgi:thioredoxin-like negative regulator of GroEL
MTKVRVRPYFAAILLLLVAAPAFPMSAEPEPLENQVRILQKQYESITQSNKDLALAGQLDEANRLLLAYVPDSEKTAAHFLFLGNLLYSLDHRLSYQLHEKAYALRADDRMVNFEWALQLHRTGKYESAIDRYQAHLNAMPEDTKTFALLADCFIRRQDYKAAVAAWGKAGHDRQHTAIDFAIHWIYGKEGPQKQRNDLLKKIRGGDLRQIEKLILLDLAWNRDWWNTSIYSEGLSRDLKEVRTLLAKEPKRLADLEAFSKRRHSEMTDEEVKAQLQENPSIAGEEVILPENSLMATALVEDMLASKLTTPQLLYQHAQEGLWKRSTSEASDVDALLLLLRFAEEVDKPRVAELSRFCWKRYNNDTCAAIYLARLQEKDAQEQVEQAWTLAR